MRFFSRNPTIFLFGTTIFLCLSSSVAAQAEKRLIVKDSSQVAKVELILTQPNISTRAPLREQDLSNYGCTFTSLEYSKNNELINIVNSSFEIKENEIKNFTLRNAIHITMKDGDKTKILLSDSIKANGRVSAKISIGTSKDSIHLQSTDSLLHQLRLWSSSGVERKSDQLEKCNFNK